jgi:hypothetical protein
MESIPNTLFEAVDLISGTTVAGVLYTFVAALYCISCKRSFSQLRSLDGKIPRQTVLTFVLASFTTLCATIDVTLLNLQRCITYVDYGALPGGPLGLAASLCVNDHEAVTRYKTYRKAANYGGYGELPVSMSISSLKSDQVWRVLILWSGTPLFRPVTLFFYAANAGK